jgi:phenylacetate-CoA ligase
VIVLEKYLRSLAFRILNVKEKQCKIMYNKRVFRRLAFDQIENIHEESFHKLKKIIDHSYYTSPYYRDLWKEIDFEPELLRKPEDIEKLPLLTKDIIEKHKSRMISEKLGADDLEMSYTGGSSGTHTSFYRDKKATANRIGRQMGILELCDYSVGDRCGLIWGVHEDLPNPKAKPTLKRWFREFAAAKETMCCTIMDSNIMANYHARLKKFRPKVLYGYPNAMSEFATFIKERKLSPIKVKTIICTAERLSEAQRKLLQEMFEGEVFNLYCTREHGCIAFECQKHSGFHIDIGSVHLEIISNGVPAEPGKTGEIVVTDLLNYGMPFIRNRIGDMGSLSTKTCDCGCNLPLLRNLDGRVTDLLYRPDGSTVAGVMLVDMFLDVPAIKAMQIIQERLDEVNLFLVVTEGYSKEIEKKAIHEMTSYMGQGIRINIRKVPEIPRNPLSGKYQEVICKVNPIK